MQEDRAVSLSNSSRQLYLTYLEGELTRATQWHHQKERMAWLATAAYIPGILVIVNSVKTKVLALSSNPGIPGNPWMLFGLIALIAVLMSATLAFVAMQFSQRWEAANRVNGFRRSVADLLARTGSKCFNRSEFSLRELDTTTFPYRYPTWWPGFVACHLEGIKEKQGRLEEYKKLKKWFRKLVESGELSRPCLDPRIRSEVASYLSIIVVSLSAVGYLFC